jgi:hypothetical protein
VSKVGGDPENNRKTAGTLLTIELMGDNLAPWSKTPMARYALSITKPEVDPLYLAASYEQTGSGIRITDKREDACSYVTIEQASAVARALRHTFNHAPTIIEVEH